MRARLKTLTTITAVLLAVTAVFIAGVPSAVRRRPRRSVLAVVRAAVRRSVRPTQPRLLLTGVALLLLVVGVFTHDLDRSAPAAHAAAPAFRLTAANDTTSTSAAPLALPALPALPPPAAVPAPVDPNALIWPAHGAIWSGFGMRAGRRHTGDDIGAPNRSTIVAAQAGTVVFAGWESGYGQETRIDHGGGIVTVYAHQSRITVRVGQRVAQGEPIGNVGSTGRVSAPHLHFEVRVNGVPQNPMRWLAVAPR
jgi:murein DD-endopeptidase MepM/ murein hydrolase activator NlpD